MNNRFYDFVITFTSYFFMYTECVINTNLNEDIFFIVLQ